MKNKFLVKFKNINKTFSIVQGQNMNFSIVQRRKINFLKFKDEKQTFDKVQGMFGWGENREDGKQKEENKVENGIFYCLVEERKQERQKIGRKIFPPGPHFFILPIWEEKVLKDALYTSNLNVALPCCLFFFFLLLLLLLIFQAWASSFLFSSFGRCPSFFSFLLFFYSFFFF